LKKIRFIINPKSGPRRNIDLESIIEGNIDRSKFDYEITYTAYQGHGVLLALEAVQLDYFGVVAVGGDGSIHEVAQSLVNTSLVLGIIALGSGNGLARSMQIPLDPAKAVQLLNELNIESIDVGKVDNNYFFSNLGVGFDATVSKAFANSATRGLSTYTKIVAQKLNSYEIKEWELTFDDRQLKVNAFLLNVANAPQFGYNFKIAPKAELQDGLLDIVVVHSFPIYWAPIVAAQAFLGNLQNNKYVDIFQEKSLSIYHKDLNSYQLDGDIFQSKSNKIDITIVPRALNVFYNQNYKHECSIF